MNMHPKPQGWALGLGHWQGTNMVQELCDLCWLNVGTALIMFVLLWFFFTNISDIGCRTLDDSCHQNLNHLMISSHLVFSPHCNELSLSVSSSDFLVFLAFILCPYSFSFPFSQLCGQEVRINWSTSRYWYWYVSLGPVSSLASFWLHGIKCWQKYLTVAKNAHVTCCMLLYERLTYKHEYCSMRAKKKHWSTCMRGLKYI